MKKSRFAMRNLVITALGHRQIGAQSVALRLDQFIEDVIAGYQESKAIGARPVLKLEPFWLVTTVEPAAEVLLRMLGTAHRRSSCRLERCEVHLVTYGSTFELEFISNEDGWARVEEDLIERGWVEREWDRVGQLSKELHWSLRTWPKLSVVGAGLGVF
jgi:hypothetical protein